ncbi:uncharacterized protein UBRO_20672 [Ustilago bromivora]|uniref:Uncharacterized protein n=1 Tax=Ustilago bromivora TaxID=307758 RepID=A0A1K0G4W8_9BASI|nr:uncharacterized protein UBRO_20672 [Ustilago bromivora]
MLDPGNIDVSSTPQRAGILTKQIRQHQSAEEERRAALLVLDGSCFVVSCKHPVNECFASVKSCRSVNKRLLNGAGARSTASPRRGLVLLGRLSMSVPFCGMQLSATNKLLKMSVSACFWLIGDSLRAGSSSETGTQCAIPVISEEDVIIRDVNSSYKHACSIQ